MQILEARTITTGSSGGATQVVETTEGLLKPGPRAITQSDWNATDDSETFGQIPGNIAVHVTDLDAEAQAALVEDPKSVASSVDSNLLTHVRTHHPDALRFHTGVCRQDDPWDPDWDRDWLEAGLISEAHAASLIPIEEETVESLNDRMADAKAFMNDQPAEDRKQVIPALHAAAPNFQALWEEVVAQGEPVVFVELHGYATAHENLSCIHETMAADGVRSPFVIATNGERYPRGHGPKVSGALLTAHYGIQTFTQKIYPWFPSEDADNSVDWWFNPERGGYENPAETGNGFQTRCPLDADHPNASEPWEMDVSSALDFRRRDETWAHQEEAQLLEGHIEAGAYDEYIGDRDLLQRGLEWMRS